MSKRLDRTIFNWKWWVLLPVMPFFMLIILMYMALDEAQDGITRAMNWSRT